MEVSFEYDEEFLKLYDKIKKLTVIGSDRLVVIKNLVQYCNKLEGSIAECGVAMGGSAMVIKNYTNKKLYLFDTFWGMPKEEEMCEHVIGQFSANIDKIKEQFKDCEIRQGMIPNTFHFKDNVFNEIEDRFCFVHLDLDLYNATKHSLGFFYDKMVEGGIILLDDYGFDQYRRGAKKAADDFFLNKPEKVVLLSTKQGMIVKL